MSLYLTLVWQAGDTAHFGMSLLFLMATAMLLWEKRQTLQFEADGVARLLGVGLMGWVLWQSWSISQAITPDALGQSLQQNLQNILRLLPLVSALAIGLVASGFRGLKQYRPELLILFFLGVPSILASYIADISPITAIFSAALLWSVGYEVSLQGVNILLPTGGVEVYSGCSGIESMTYLLGISVIWLMMFPQPRQQQILFPLLAVTTGFVVNGFRVALMAILSAAQQKASFDYWHTGDGSLIFGLIAIVVFVAFSGLLSRSTGSQPSIPARRAYALSPVTMLEITESDLSDLEAMVPPTPSDRSAASSNQPAVDKRPKLTSFLDQIWSSNVDLSQSFRPLHWIGYGILILSFFDILETLIPPNFFNPVWELETYGAIVEQSLVPLLGLGIIFLGGQQDRATWELKLLKFLSQFTLIAGIIFFLLLPLGIFNTVRIDRASNQQIDSELESKAVEIQQAKQQLEQVQTAEELQAFLATFGSDAIPNFTSAEQLQQAKQQIATTIATETENLEAQAATARSNQQITLLKKSVKWSIGALVTGTLFISIWRGTGWARVTDLEVE